MAGVAFEHLVDLFLDDLPWGAEDRRVEVALQRSIFRDPFAGLAEGDAPIDADHIGPCVGHQTQQLTGADAEVDAGHAGCPNGFEHLGACRHGVLLVVLGAE